MLNSYIRKVYIRLKYSKMSKKWFTRYIFCSSLYRLDAKSSRTSPASTATVSRPFDRGEQAGGEVDEAAHGAHQQPHGAPPEPAHEAARAARRRALQRPRHHAAHALHHALPQPTTLHHATMCYAVGRHPTLRYTVV